ncbi:MAG: hypothetical protein M1816_004479 [Peltula sp. TS41687]|nr:MAG: hypothetical protein M1816_004479 [Peltula sp. TS41687]
MESEQINFYLLVIAFLAFLTWFYSSIFRTFIKPKLELLRFQLVAWLGTEMRQDYQRVFRENCHYQQAIERLTAELESRTTELNRVIHRVRSQANHDAMLNSEGMETLRQQLDQVKGERDYERQSCRSLRSQLASASVPQETAVAAAGSGILRRNGRKSSLRDSSASPEAQQSIKRELEYARGKVREHLDAESRARSEVDRLTEMLQKRDVELSQAQRAERDLIAELRDEKARSRTEMEAALQKKTAKIRGEIEAGIREEAIPAIRAEVEASLREELESTIRKDLESALVPVPEPTLCESRVAIIREHAAVELREEYDAILLRVADEIRRDCEGKLDNVVAARTLEIEDRCRKVLDQRLQEMAVQHQREVGELRSALDRNQSEKAGMEGQAQRLVATLRERVSELEQRPNSDGLVRELEKRNGELTQRLHSLESMPSQTTMFPVAVMHQLQARRDEIAKPTPGRPDRYAHVRSPQLLSAWIKELESILSQQSTKWRYSNTVQVRTLAYRALTHEISTLVDCWDVLLQLDITGLAGAIMGSNFGLTLQVVCAAPWKNSDEAAELLGKLKDLLGRLAGLNWLPKKPAPGPSAAAPPKGMLAPRYQPQRPPQSLVVPSGVPRLNAPRGSPLNPVPIMISGPSPIPSIPTAPRAAPSVPLPRSESQGESVNQGARERAPSPEPQPRRVEQPVAPPSQPEEAPSSRSKKRSLDEADDRPGAKHQRQE